MKNNDKTIPYEPTPAELDRFNLRWEKTSTEEEEDGNLAGGLNATTNISVAMLVVLVVVLIVIMIGMWNSSMLLATVSWNG
jgi:hypothetical protein